MAVNKIFTKYKGYWISVSEDYKSVFAYSKDLDKLVGQIKRKKIKKGIIARIPSGKYSAYAG